MGAFLKGKQGKDMVIIGILAFIGFKLMNFVKPTSMFSMPKKQTI